MFIALLLATYLCQPLFAFDLSQNNFKHITFDDIPETVHRYENEHEKGRLIFEVKKSASFLLKPFNKIRSISMVSFLWYSKGSLKVTSAEHEASKSGDDFRLRVGIILSGKKPWIPFFVPTWIKSIESSMSLPSDQIIYLVVSTKHPPGKSWQSPFSDSIEYIAIDSAQTNGKWRKANYTFSKPQNAVGIWLMADGDDTQSIFTTYLKDLNLQP